MRYYHYIIAVILACGTSGAYWVLQRDTSIDSISDEPAEQVPGNDEVMQASVAIGAAREAGPEMGDAVEPEDLNDRLKTLGLSEEEIAERKRIEQLREAADRRFNTTVATDNLSADRVPESVRKLFKTMTLEPVLALEGQEGYIDGMRIADITGANPLAKAGFRSGDHLVSFNGLPLKDPAEIAYLFADLTDQFEVCAERGGDLHCRLVSLAGG